MKNNKITLATLNTLGNPFQVDNLILRYGAIASFFDASDIDVVHFQEVFSYPHLLILKRKLKEYPYCIYRKGYLGPKGGLVTFSRVPLEFVNYVSFTKKHLVYLKKSIFTQLVVKGILETKVKNSNVYLTNLHMSAVYDGDWSNTGVYVKRLASEISEFNAYLAHLPKEGRITIISGDFNTAKESNFYNKLIQNSLIYDPFEKSNKPTFHPEFLPIGRKNNCIDYIFIHGNKKNYFVLDRKRILEEKIPLNTKLINFASDHVGLQVTIELTI